MAEIKRICVLGSSGAARVIKTMLHELPDICVVEGIKPDTPIVEIKPRLKEASRIINHEPLYRHPRRGRSKGERKRNPRWKRR